VKKILVDTSIWSVALRRQKNTKEERRVIQILSELVTESQVVIIGMVRQELLSGISSQKVFEELRDKMSIIDDVPALECDYLAAAELSNTCRRKGVQGSSVDFLICAIAIRSNLLILTTDKDFSEYARHIPIQLLPIQ
jgi:predicted nucleic acid-binding protein